jgi:hypothetical protein
MLRRTVFVVLLTHALITLGFLVGSLAPTALAKVRASAPAMRRAAGLRNRTTVFGIEAM